MQVCARCVVHACVMCAVEGACVRKMFLEYVMSHSLTAQNKERCRQKDKQRENWG